MINFNFPVVSRKAKKYVRKTFTLNKFSGDGYFNSYATELLQSICGNKNIITTSSCSHSLEIALMLLNLDNEDEVLIPDWTFTSVVNAVLTQGGRPVFVDCNLNPPLLTFNSIKQKITEKTKAIILVNYNGFVMDLDLIENFCKQKNIYLIQDSAHSLNTNFKKLKANGLGFASTFSFHETKNIQCGEGGALIVNDDEEFENAIQIKDKGTNRKEFIEGKVEKYQWIRKGSSYLLAEPLAAILAANLEKLKVIQNKRKNIWNFYQVEFNKITEQYGILTPIIPSDSSNGFHIYYLILPSIELRNRYVNYMRENKINVVFHYQSLSSSKAGIQFNKKLETFPNSVRLSQTLVRLPIYYGLKKFQTEKVIEKTFNFLDKFI